MCQKPEKLLPKKICLLGKQLPCKVELGIEPELAGGDAVLGAEGLILGQTGVGEGRRGGLAGVPADEHALEVIV